MHAGQLKPHQQENQTQSQLFTLKLFYVGIEMLFESARHALDIKVCYEPILGNSFDFLLIRASDCVTTIASWLSWARTSPNWICIAAVICIVDGVQSALNVQQRFSCSRLAFETPATCVHLNELRGISKSYETKSVIAAENIEWIITSMLISSTAPLAMVTDDRAEHPCPHQIVCWHLLRWCHPYSRERCRVSSRLGCGRRLTCCVKYERDNLVQP